MQIEIIKSMRKTVLIEINSDLSLTVKVPIYMTEKQIEAFLSRKQNWIEKNIEKIRQRANGVGKLNDTDKNELIAKAKEVLPPKVEHLAEKVGVKYNRVTVRCQKTRWGSCSSKKNLNFNCLLILCPEEIQDYVIIHELCHLKELNHSSAFWKEVEKYCPDYKAHRNWLKNNGVGYNQKNNTHP